MLLAHHDDFTDADRLDIAGLGPGAAFDPDLFPDRDALIRHLVGVCGWKRAKVALFFGVTDRQVRRITTPVQLAADVPLPADSSTLSRAEIRAMVRDYARDPYQTPAQREAAWDYLARGCPELDRCRPDLGAVCTTG